MACLQSLFLVRHAPALDLDLLFIAHGRRLHQLTALTSYPSEGPFLENKARLLVHFTHRTPPASSSAAYRHKPKHSLQSEKRAPRHQKPLCWYLEVQTLEPEGLQRHQLTERERPIIAGKVHRFRQQQANGHAQSLRNLPGNCKGLHLHSRRVAGEACAAARIRRGPVHHVRVNDRQIPSVSSQLGEATAVFVIKSQRFPIGNQDSSIGNQDSSIAN